MRKKLLCCAILAALIIPLVPALGGCGFQDSDLFEYKYHPDDYDGYYEIIECKDKELKKVSIPSKYDGLPVKIIGERVFQGYDKLEKVTIPNSITEIGSSAFSGCVKLEKISIPKSVTTIGSYAFEGCQKLKKISIPKSVTYIGAYAFSDTDVIQNSRGVHYVGKWVVGHDSVSPLEIKNGTLGIASGAFSETRHEGAMDISIPASVRYINDNAFATYSIYITNITITYEGTLTQWEEINSYDFWARLDSDDSRRGQYIIHCTDGTLGE